MRLLDFFVQDMIRMVVMLFPVYVVVRVAYLVARRRKPDWSREPLSGVCAAYGIALLSQTLLPHGLYGIEDLVLFSQSLPPSDTTTTMSFLSTRSRRTFSPRTTL